MKDSTEFYALIQRLKRDGAAIQKLARTNQREKRRALRNKLRQEILLNSNNLTQEQVIILLNEMGTIFSLMASIVCSSEISEEERGDAVDSALWELKAHARILEGVQGKTLQDIFLLYDWSKMFFDVTGNEDFKKLGESLKKTANAAIGNYVTDSYAEQKAIANFFANKMERIIDSLPTLTDESVLKDKRETLAFALGIILRYKPEYAVSGDSFPEACRESWARIHGFLELERRTHLSFYRETACHIRACLKAQILLDVKKLDAKARDDMIDMLSERLSCLNEPVTEEGEKAGTLKEVAFAEYASSCLRHH